MSHVSHLSRSRLALISLLLRGRVGGFSRPGGKPARRIPTPCGEYMRLAGHRDWLHSANGLLIA
jgi:hypothetical protein